MNSLTERLDRFAQRAGRALALIGLFGLFALAGMTIADVLLRWLFASPIDGLSDIGELIVIFMVAACFPAAFANRQHLAFRVLGGWLGWRANEFLECLGHLAALAFITIVAWQLSLYTADLWSNRQTTWLLAIPMWPSWLLTTVLVVLCVPIQALIFFIHLARLFSSERPREILVGDEAELQRLVNENPAG